MALNDYEVVVVGGGFYGCCLALFLRSIATRVILVEAEKGLLERASRVNQARVHGGFHYPRSFATALRSRVLQERFVRDFEDAVLADFHMLYAIATRRSKVSAPRFARMFQAVGAPISRAPRHLQHLFNAELIEDVFLCREYAFDWLSLRAGLIKRLERQGVVLRLGQSVEAATCEKNRVVVHFNTGQEITAEYLFNVTYANLNTFARCSGLAQLSLKHELAELALIRPPLELAKLAVTVMDGPFFSTMPYPSEQLYSLTHVRYTPHVSWSNSPPAAPGHHASHGLQRSTRWRHMVQDAKRYLPCMQDATYVSSLFEVKTVLRKSERDDGRPIVLHRHHDGARIYSILGAKIDNIYDLFEALPQLDARWRDAKFDLLES